MGFLRIRLEGRMMMDEWKEGRGCWVGGWMDHITYTLRLAKFGRTEGELEALS